MNIDFHEAIYRATHSQYFEQLLSDINYYIHVTSRHSIKQPNRLVEAAQEHKEIYEAIVKKDKALAKVMILVFFFLIKCYNKKRIGGELWKEKSFQLLVF